MEVRAATPITPIAKAPDRHPEPSRHSPLPRKAQLACCAARFSLRRLPEMFVRGSMPEPDSGRCQAGFQCLPNTAWRDESDEANYITDNYGYDGACVPCTYGQYCPENTTNVYVLQAYMNVCPPGFNCRAPKYIEPCPAGRFCQLGTYAGGIECTSERIREDYQSWGQAIHCPEASRPDERGAIKFLCPAGSFCPNASTSLPCPNGTFCPMGVNASTPCRDSLGRSADERCPSGSSYEPSSPDNLVYLLAVAAPILFLLELCSCCEKRFRRRRHSRLAVFPSLGCFCGRQKRSGDDESITSPSRNNSYRTRLRGRMGLARGASENIPADERDDAARWFLGQQLGRLASTMGTSRRRANPTNQGHASCGQVVLNTGRNGAVCGAATDRPVSNSSLKATRSSGLSISLARLERSASDNESIRKSGRTGSWLPSALSTRSLDGINEDAIARGPASACNPYTPGVGLKRLASDSDPFTAQEMDETLLQVLDDGGSARMRGRTLLKLELRGIHFRIRQAPVLIDINTVLQQGQLIGLMGESGSGKTTLLNVLGGRAGYGWTTGDMRLNSRTYQPRSLRHLLGYVPQAHLVFKELTVYENLAYAAKMRLHSSVPPAQRAQLVDMALDLLGLQSCRHFVCDPAIGERLSGGQMRRVGIGVELVCDPPIMLLDEPTSALDAVNTRLVAAALKNLARRGVLVVASLHQPRHIVYEMLDRLLLLRKGELIFGGMREHALRYFEQLGYQLVGHNPADFFIEVAFGYEFSSKKLKDLPECFGMRRTLGGNEADAKTPSGATCTKDSEVRADTLGLLWRSWYHTSLASVGKIMGIIAKRQSDDRRRALAVLQFARRVSNATAKSGMRRSQSLGTFMSFRRGGPPSDANSTPSEDSLARTIWNGLSSPRSGSTGSRRLSGLLSPRGSRDRSSRNGDAIEEGQSCAGESARRVSPVPPPSLPPSPPVGGLPADFYHQVQLEIGKRGVTTPGEVRDAANAETRVSSRSSTESAESSIEHMEVREGLSLDLSMLKLGFGGKTSTISSSPGRSSPASTPQHLHAIDIRSAISPSSIDTPGSDQTSPNVDSRKSARHDDASAKARRLSSTAAASAKNIMKTLNFSQPSPHSPRAGSPRSVPRHRLSKIGEVEGPVSRKLLEAFPVVGVTREEFKKWFGTKNEGFGDSLRPELADQVWDRAATVAMQGAQDGRHRWQFHMASFQQLFQGAPQERSLLPTWTQLRGVMYSWPMPRGEQPGWATHFVVCTQRYIYKLLRTRLRIYLLLIVTGFLGMLCGVLHGSNPPYNDCLIFYLLFNTMFGTLCATSSIGTFAGDVHFFWHEAASGVSQSAEGLARLLVDMLPLACLTPVFTLPLYSFASLHVNVVFVYLLFSWSLSPLGYIFTLIATGNATVLTSSATFVFCAFANGFFGIKRTMLFDRFRWLLRMSPGYPAFLLVSYGSALGEPLSTKRWAIIRQLYMAEMLPMLPIQEFNETEAPPPPPPPPSIAEFGDDPNDPSRHLWAEESMLNLFIIGLVLRVATLILFYFRSTFTLVGWTDNLHNAVLVRVGLRREVGRRSCCHKKTEDELEAASRRRVTLGISRRSGWPLAPMLASPVRSRKRSPSSAPAAATPAAAANVKVQGLKNSGGLRGWLRKEGSLAKGKASCAVPGRKRAATCAGPLRSQQYQAAEAITPPRQGRSNAWSPITGSSASSFAPQGSGAHEAQGRFRAQTMGELGLGRSERCNRLVSTEL